MKGKKSKRMVVCRSYIGLRFFKKMYGFLKSRKCQFPKIHCSQFLFSSEVTLLTQLFQRGLWCSRSYQLRHFRHYGVLRNVYLNFATAKIELESVLELIHQLNLCVRRKSKFKLKIFCLKLYKWVLKFKVVRNLIKMNNWYRNLIFFH